MDTVSGSAVVVDRGFAVVDDEVRTAALADDVVRTAVLEVVAAGLTVMVAV